MRDYYANKNDKSTDVVRKNIKNSRSKNIPTDAERKELIKKYLEPPKKVKLTFIGEPSDSYYSKRSKPRHYYETEEITKKSTKYVRTLEKRDYDKYSGIQAYGDSGREFREEDWNDEIARNFQKELRKMRKFRNQMGWSDVDCGALK